MSFEGHEWEKIVKIIVISLFCLLLACTMGHQADSEAIYRVNCGSLEPYVDRAGLIWTADQSMLHDTSKWGAVGGSIIRRDNLPALDSVRPEVYRTERYIMEQYRFPVAPGYYMLRLHFAETFPPNNGPGLRQFGVSVNGRLAIDTVDPFRDAGGFSRSCVYEIRGVRPRKGLILLGFHSDSGKHEINGIEVLRQRQSPYTVSLVSDPHEVNTDSLSEPEVTKDEVSHEK